MTVTDTEMCIRDRVYAYAYRTHWGYVRDVIEIDYVKMMLWNCEIRCAL